MDRETISSEVLCTIGGCFAGTDLERFGGLFLVYFEKGWADGHTIGSALKEKCALDLIRKEDVIWRRLWQTTI